MLGSLPCYPGAGNIEEYKNRYFYCQLCAEVVSPYVVPVVVVDVQGAPPTGILQVLRCKQHKFQGLPVHGPITSLWALEPVGKGAPQLESAMYELCSQVRNFDICSIVSWVFGGLCIFAGLIVGVMVEAPLIAGLSAWVIPCIIGGIGAILCLFAILMAYLGRGRVREWLNLSHEYITQCHCRQIQAHSQNYSVITEYPATCALSQPITKLPNGSRRDN
ncbi:conserved hypothetical protein [Chlamydia pneumoniae LPCoLN]|uniref:hypothetical protein n=1 Tax=Chlamydia pneumoniae TaxID=83558 RepID=UPI0001BD9EA6|nr:hypothetical protein [Chlamydia pneumoniae]ACZ33458.1 conserved hypothetical protein [Chlamydia pneumoniae LPCoLN]ETR80378.1 hypothetical protein X556_0298 [Chlamydia pneumoniae B21]